MGLRYISQPVSRNSSFIASLWVPHFSCCMQVRLRAILVLYRAFTASLNMAEGTEVRLNEPPQDGVSSVKFSKQQGSPFLLVSSWDQVRPRITGQEDGIEAALT